MGCPYCRASNLPDDHRCQRCGRRLDGGSSGFARPSYGRGGTARALQVEAEPSVNLENPEPPASDRPIYQPSLFPSRLVSFESYAPEAVKPRSRPPAGRAKSKPAPVGQESFEFETVIQQAAPVQKAGEPAIACHHRVADILQRCMAAAIDVSMVVVAVALFVGVVYVGGGRVILDARSATLCLGLAAFFYLMYELLWSMAGTDTAGMRWSGLRLVDFDGESPDPHQRLMRAAGGCLSVLSAGLGVLWALVDEESLTWHDHISKTFPTTYRP